MAPTHNFSRPSGEWDGHSHLGMTTYNKITGIKKPKTLASPKKFFLLFFGGVPHTEKVITIRSACKSAKALS